MNIHIEISSATTKRLLVLGAAASVVLSVAVARAVPAMFNTGEVLTADQLNQSFASIPVITDWASYPCSLFVGSETVDADAAGTTCTRRRVGDSVEIHVETVLADGVSTMATGMIAWSLPDDVVWDPAKGARGNRGAGSVGRSPTDNHICCFNVSGDGLKLYGYCDGDMAGANTLLRAGYPSTWTAGLGIEFTVSFPVKGWTATTAM